MPNMSHIFGACSLWHRLGWRRIGPSPLILICRNGFPCPAGSLLIDNDLNPWNCVRRIFWFPDNVVHERDLVVPYAKRGAQPERQKSDGSTSYFFYWNL